MQYRSLDDIEYLVVHHPVGDIDVAQLQYEQSTQGIGYNFYIKDDDEPYNNLAEAVELLPMTVVSNGVYGVNYQSWNICVAKGNGNFDEEPLTQADDVVKKLIQVLAVKAKLLGWQQADISRIIGHQWAGMHISPEYYVTACPGQHMINLLSYVRQQVARYLPP